MPCPGSATRPSRNSRPREDGVTSGHGCGHNLIGGGSMGAALAMKNLLAEKKIPGTLRVFGTAAEESEGAKVFMARDGVFNDVDAMLHWHPMDFALRLQYPLGGVPTHASSDSRARRHTPDCIPGEAGAPWTPWRFSPTA